MRTSPRKRSRLEAGLGGLCALLSTAGASAAPYWRSCTMLEKILVHSGAVR